MTKPIDFILCWVDDSDPEWQREKRYYSPSKQVDNRKIRYRDWDLLHYWFRGVEKFAPWVNKIHFVTYGHIPKWLNTCHPKLNIVRHEDYIPKEFLPTFSARPIEINLHRIKGLAEQFVYFNDDMYLINNVSEDYFFSKGKPRDVAALDIINSPDYIHSNAKFNSTYIINKHFNKRKSIIDNFFKWYNFKNLKTLIRSTLLFPWSVFPGFYTPHLPNSFLKSTFEEVWEKEKDILEQTSQHKFRETTDVTQYLFKFWQLASGNFATHKSNGELFNIGINQNEILEAVRKQKYSIVCLNDNNVITNFEDTK